MPTKSNVTIPSPTLLTTNYGGLRRNPSYSIHPSLFIPFSTTVNRRSCMGACAQASWRENPNAVTALIGQRHQPRGGALGSASVRPRRQKKKKSNCIVASHRITRWLEFPPWARQGLPVLTRRITSRSSGATLRVGRTPTGLRPNPLATAVGGRSVDEIDIS